MYLHHHHHHQQPNPSHQQQQQQQPPPPQHSNTHDYEIHQPLMSIESAAPPPPIPLPPSANPLAFLQIQPNQLKLENMHGSQYALYDTDPPAANSHHQPQQPHHHSLQSTQFVLETNNPTSNNNQPHHQLHQQQPAPHNADPNFEYLFDLKHIHDLNNNIANGNNFNSTANGLINSSNYRNKNKLTQCLNHKNLNKKDNVSSSNSNNNHNNVNNNHNNNNNKNLIGQLRSNLFINFNKNLFITLRYL